jgi:hypothetical protein
VQCLTELFVVNQMDKIHFICGYIPAKKVFDIFGRVYIHYIKKYGKIFNEFDMSGGKGKVELKMKAMEENISFEYIFKD